MRVNDALTGALLAVLGAALVVYVQSFPSMPGQRFGAALSPGLIGAGLVLAGLELVRRGLTERAPLVTLAAWTRSPRLAGNVLLLVAAVVFYIVAVDTLGFVVCSVAILLALFLKLRARPLVAIVVAIGTTLAIHALFYKLLRVPLAWGVLQPIAW
jgi:putative tricarboxylic transport membrane protein